jgi:membrane-bound lytic murein transglycosylase A
MRFKKILVIASVCVFVTSCATQKPRIAKFKPVTFEQVDGWEQDSHAGAFNSFKRSCDKILRLDVEKNISRATDLGGSAIDWQVPCMEAKMIDNPTDSEAKAFFEKWFLPYQVFDDSHSPEGMLTGYFQIELEGSKKKHGRYKYPIYRKPPDLDSLKGSSAIEHAAINSGVLAGKGLEVAYVDNRARLYFMQIQGSGVVKLKEGGNLNLGFEDHNGYRFRGINEALKQKNLKFDNARSMMDYLHENPKDGREIMEQDPSYVFFRPVEGQHAVGGHGVPLHPERSLAVDYGLYPYGMPVWVSTSLPERSIFKGRDYKRLFIAQDTGGAIRGAIRGDVFFGRGHKAEKVASHFKAKGKFFAFFPKTVKVPDSYTAR